MAKAPFPIDPVLTGIIVGYRNRRYIADDVLPRFAPLTKEEFTYTKMTIAERFTLPDTKVGRKSAPAEIEFTGTRVTDKTEDYGLDDVVPYNDQANAPEGYSPIDNAAIGLTDLVALDRERRAAALVFTAANYPAANQSTLAGTSQWSDFTNSDPIAAIQSALDVPLLRPNTMTIGRAAFSVLVRHPKIVKAVLGNAGDSGIARRQDLAELFELDEVLVGESFLNAAKKGQTASYSRVWGKHCSLFFKDPLATNDNERATFGLTAQYGTKVAGQIDEPKTGLRGATRVRSGESVKEFLVANELGYFFQNAVA